MKLKNIWVLAAGLALTMSVNADAVQDVIKDVVKDIKPGLWEVQHKTAVDGQQLPDMNKMLEKVPPEMRAQVEAMMAKRGAALASGKAIRVCMTAEQIARQQYGNDPRNRCQVSDVKHSGNTTHFSMQCSKPKGQGDTTVTRLSSEAWSSVTQMTVEEMGAPHTVHSEASAKWLSSDCGTVKPAEQAPEPLSPEQKEALKVQAQKAAAQALLRQ